MRRIFLLTLLVLIAPFFCFARGDGALRLFLR